MRHMHGQIQDGLLREQGGIDDVYLVIVIGLASHKRERELAAYQSFSDIDAVDQKKIPF